MKQNEMNPRHTNMNKTQKKMNTGQKYMNPGRKQSLIHLKLKIYVQDSFRQSAYSVKNVHYSFRNREETKNDNE